MVDDNPGDARLLQEAFVDRQSCVDLNFAGDGMEALNVLRNVDSMPDLIVLDIKMPGMSGLELLRVIRDDPRLRDAMVIILTGSDAPEDRRAAQRLGVIDYCIKPDRLDGWIALSTKLEKLARPVNNGRTS